MEGIQPQLAHCFPDADIASTVGECKGVCHLSLDECCALKYCGAPWLQSKERCHLITRSGKSMVLLVRSGPGTKIFLQENFTVHLINASSLHNITYFYF